jgi:hypothetical protein
MLSQSLAAVIAIALLALRSLAFASPPDPSWIAGFWDDADYDDVVNLITSTSASPVSHPPVVPSPSIKVVSLITATDDQPVAVPAPLLLQPRAPPSR